MRFFRRMKKMEWLLDEGRKHPPDFHVTSDFIHPSKEGHLAIAMGMLKGFGEAEAMNYLFARKSLQLWDSNQESLSWRVEHLGTDDAKDRFRIRFDHLGATRQARPTLELPREWKIVSVKAGDAGGEFVVEGVWDRLENIFVIHAGKSAAKVVIPAPWLIGSGNIGSAGSKKMEFIEPTKTAFFNEDRFGQGLGFNDPVSLKSCNSVVWKRHFASMDYGGGNSPGAIDFAAVRFYQNFDIAYDVRWIFSEKDSPISLEIQSSPANNSTVWLSGDSAFFGSPNQAELQKVTVHLKTGWNTLVFKSNHFQAQWQFKINLSGENLDRLRVSMTPP